MSKSHQELMRLFRPIYQVVRKVPKGTVATYGQVALLAGYPRGGRIAGRALKLSTPKMKLPWHRIIGKQSATRGKISIHDPVGAAIQRQLLESEGVEISDTGTISLARFGWLPQ